MNESQLIQTAEALLTPWSQGLNQPAVNRLDVAVDTGDLVAAVDMLQQAQWGYLATITGLDLGVEAGQMELLYHFCAGAAVVTLRVKVARETAVVPTICSVIPSASFFEREVSEMLGITVTDTPNPKHLFLPEEWPAGVYPLRKDFIPAAAEK